MNSSVRESAARFPRLPSVDEVLRTDAAAVAIERFGRPAVAAAVRGGIDAARTLLRAGQPAETATDAVMKAAAAKLEADARPNVRPVFNLTGTVLHTNLGRAILAEAGDRSGHRSRCARRWRSSSTSRADAAASAMRWSAALLCELTGAEDATVVNNNAAAVLLVLNTLANGTRGDRLARRADRDRRRVPHARHHGARGRQAGRGRHHQPHPSEGLTRRGRRQDRSDPEGAHLELPDRGLHEGGAARRACRDRQRPMACRWSTISAPARWSISRATACAHEPTVAEAVADGADLVTFSGDKLLGGPQAGFIVGRRDLIAQINRNPMKRALRLDKMRLAALEATLASLPRSRPARRAPADDPPYWRARRRRSPARPRGSCRSVAGGDWAATSRSSKSSLARVRSARARCRPETIASAGLAGSAAARQPAAPLPRSPPPSRQLPVPVIGRIEDRSLILDLRCLDDEAGFVGNLAALNLRDA